MNANTNYVFPCIDKTYAYNTEIKKTSSTYSLIHNSNPIIYKSNILVYP